MKKQIIIGIYMAIATSGCFAASINTETPPAGVRTRILDLVITGRTNINTFQLFLDKQDSRSREFTGSQDNSDITFFIPVDILNCNNQFLLKDFNSMVKSSDYPLIVIRIGNNELDGILAGIQKHTIHLAVTLTDHTQILPAQVTVVQNKQNQSILNGTLALKLSDFRLQPPQFCWGLVKLNNTIEINFKIAVSKP